MQQIIKIKYQIINKNRTGSSERALDASPGVESNGNKNDPTFPGLHVDSYFIWRTEPFACDFSIIMFDG